MPLPPRRARVDAFITTLKLSGSIDEYDDDDDDGIVNGYGEVLLA